MTYAHVLVDVAAVVTKSVSALISSRAAGRDRSGQLAPRAL